MNIIKVTKLNDDGSVAFEGLFGPNEVQFTLEMGINFILQQGAMSIAEAGDEEDDEPLFEMEGPSSVQ